MPIQQRFRSSIAHCNYTFKNGKTVPFLNGEYITDIEEEIKELQAEIKSGNSYFNQGDADTNVVLTDPMDEIRARARQEALEQFRAEQAAAMDKSRNTESDQDFKLRVANSDDVNSAMSGSTSMDIPVAGTASVASSAPQGTGVPTAHASAENNSSIASNPALADKLAALKNK